MGEAQKQSQISKIMKNKNFLIGAISLAIAHIVWGIGTPLMKVALTQIPIFVLAFARFGVAALIIFLISKKGWEKMEKSEIITMMISGFFGVFILISLFFWGLTLGESINASLIAASVPIFVYLMAVVFLHEKPNQKIFQGLILGSIGVVIIVISPLLVGASKLSGSLGANILFFLAMMGMAIDTIVAKPVATKYPPLQVTFWSFFSASCGFLILATLLGQWQQFDIFALRGEVVFSYFWGLLGMSLLSYTLFYLGVGKLKASESGLFNYFNPLAATFVGVNLLGEKLTIYHLIGSVLVVIGIYIAEKNKLPSLKN